MFQNWSSAAVVIGALAVKLQVVMMSTSSLCIYDHAVCFRIIARLFCYFTPLLRIIEIRLYIIFGSLFIIAMGMNGAIFSIQRIALQYFRTQGRAFMNKKNSMGPSIESLGPLIVH